ncbi:MAG: hypothetical protein IPL26_05055 [Leptospiraceae bacterium]|nr:hypothetical protein [Leptospiraceae bacterium]
METDFLLDTHTFIYWHLEEKSLSKKVLKILERQENNFFISSLSILEIQYLVEIGRLEMDMGDIFLILIALLILKFFRLIDPPPY